MVNESGKSKCKLDECKSGKCFLLEILINETDDSPEEIVFNQRVSNDSAQLITEIMSTEDFFRLWLKTLYS